MLVAIALLPAACIPQRTEHLEGSTMSTTWRITVRNTHSRPSSSACQDRLDALEQLFSNWRTTSAVSVWNRSRSTDFQPVPRELAEVVDLALRTAHDSGGALDVTLAPVIDVWGFGSAGPVASPPSDGRIRAALQHCGWQRLEVKLQPPMLRKTDPDLTINLSTLVEGYAADELAKMLRAEGFSNFLVEVGSALVAEDGPWFIGVQTPGAPQGDALAGLPVVNAGVSTAGTYRKRFSGSGRTYSHIIDPTTGKPVQSRLESVTVFARNAAEADAWDTALLVLGPDRGRSLANELKMRAVFLEAKE